MQLLNFENTNSIAKTNQIIPILLSKTSDPCNSFAEMGELNASLRAFSQASTPHTNVLIQCIGEVLRYGQKATPSTRIAKQIEFLKLNNGDFQNA